MRRTCTAELAMNAADDLLADYRTRYGQPQPAAPEAVWYDEPPFAKDGKKHPCWIGGCAGHGDVHWSRAYDEWRVWIVGSACQQPLAGRPVSPIHKPQEPTT